MTKLFAILSVLFVGFSAHATTGLTCESTNSYVYASAAPIDGTWLLQDSQIGDEKSGQNSTLSYKTSADSSMKVKFDLNGNGKAEAVALLKRTNNPEYNEEADGGDVPAYLWVGVVSYYDSNKVIAKESMTCFFAQ